VAADYDLAIVGSGFGGSLLAMIATRLGLRVILLERGRHPRFAIGESASPLAGIMLEQLADRYDLPRIRPLSAYGTWQRAYPRVVCGLKRGFTYFRHERGRKYDCPPERSNQLLVEASPNDELSDTHWLRSDVDAFLVREATALGVEYVDEIALDDVEWRADGSALLTATRHQRTSRIAVRFIVDASGPRGFIGRALGNRNRGFDGYPATQALFSHFIDVARCDAMPEYGFEGGPKGPPYPVDEAALHHVFDGGWMWVLRFNNGVTSAGIAVTDDLAADLRLSDGASAWPRFLARYPSIAAQFADAKPIREFTWMPQLSWRADVAAGPGWAMLPSAAAFVDPLFSTGIPLTLLGIERIARLLERARLGVGSWEWGVADAWDEYSRMTLGEGDHTADFIAGCYAAFSRFDEFMAYSMFYFAAASYAEMARRLGVTAHSSRFLGADDERFASAIRDLSPARTMCILASVERAIEHRNIAGLCNPAKKNWYGIDLEDTVSGAGKFGLTCDEVRHAVVAMFTPGVGCR
jgi:FADH2 O2-dependent halogenase